MLVLRDFVAGQHHPVRLIIDGIERFPPRRNLVLERVCLLRHENRPALLAETPGGVRRPFRTRLICVFAPTRRQDRGDAPAVTDVPNPNIRRHPKWIDRWIAAR